MPSFLVTWAGLVALLLLDRRTNRKLNTIMANQQTDQQLLDEIVTDLNNAEASVADEITKLEAQVAALPAPATPIDFSGLRAALEKYKSLVPLPAGTSSTPGDGAAPAAA